ncbi:ankyrin repeat domain-containing protein [Scytonema sp. NUACC26]|uniref:ankyrin repeat domain-containing protein n=1 Tax=Scytonema sp. NUACC26 TaxID=3140176 RepID=UPI0038B3E231
MNTEKSLNLEERKLSEAVKSGNLQLVQELMTQGVNVNHWANEEWDEYWEDFLTPLEQAVVMKNKNIVQVLLQAEVDVHNWRQTYICRALDIAALLGDIEIAQMLIQPLKTQLDEYILNPLLIHAVQGGSNEIVQILLGYGADINFVSVEGTPLLAAASKGNLQMVKLLVEAGANVNFVSDESPFLGALGLAAKYGHQDVYEYLLTLVTDTDERDFARRELPQGILRKKTQK